MSKKSSPIFPQLAEIREKAKERVEEAKAKIKELKQGGSKSQLQAFRKQVKEKGLISAIKARREERLAKAKMSKGEIKTYPPAEKIVPPVLLYSQEEVPPAVKIKTY